MEFVNAAQAAQPFVLALRIQANHDHIFSLMLRALLAQVFVVVKTHPYKRFYKTCIHKCKQQLHIK